MTTARDIITRGLRLINVPGRGAVLSADDAVHALEALQDIINTEAVSKAFVPGIRRHFFALQDSKSIYSYGPGGEFDTNDFFDPVPVGVEDVYIREGSTVSSNEVLQNGDFNAQGAWENQNNDWVFADGAATLSAGDTGILGQSFLPVVRGKKYILRLSAVRTSGSLRIQISDSLGVFLLDAIVDASGDFEFEFDVLFSSNNVGIAIFATDATAAYSLLDASILLKGQDKVFLPDTQGSDYAVSIVDQFRYNRRFTKGTGGRPYEILYSRAFPLGEIRFDNSAINGDILVMDVLVNRVSVTSLDSEIRLHPDGIKWLKYRLGYEMAGEYGKVMRPDQMQIMEQAWDRLAAGNKRQNTLEVDRALRGRPTFDINRGDP